jgi:ABC-type amino acid transport system permease subunit
VARKPLGTLTSNNSDSLHTPIIPIVLYRLCTVATPEHLEHLLSKYYVRIVAIAPDLRRAFFHGVTEILPHGTSFELLSLLILIKRALSEPQSLTAYQEVVISLVAAIACIFMQSRYADRYSNRSDHQYRLVQDCSIRTK